MLLQSGNKGETRAILLHVFMCFVQYQVVLISITLFVLVFRLRSRRRYTDISKAGNHNIRMKIKSIELVSPKGSKCSAER